MRTFGSLKRVRKDKRWVWQIQAEPHVITRVKRMFKGGDDAFNGKLTISDTDEICRDLQWVLTRYPLVMSEEDASYLETQSTRYDTRTLEFTSILEGNLDPRPFELAIPAREYQKIAAELILRTPGLLCADDLGLGKTLSAIASFCEPSTRPVLVVTMTHLTIQWQNEIAKFAPNLKTHLVKKGTPYPLTTKRSPQFPDVIIMNYHKVAGWASTLAGVVNLVVFDEGQELRRNTSDKYKGCKVIADAAKYRVALTSTPIYNYGIEFFNLMDVLLPGKLGTQEEFTREWCFGAGDKVNIKDPVAFGAYLREQGMMIRRTRKDVNREIPGINKIIHHVDCDEKALNTVAKDVAELAKFLLRQGGSGFDKMKAGGELDWRLRQATGIAKAPFAAEFIKLLLESGEPVLVYCWHHAVYDILEDKLKEYNPVRYTGEESIHQKEKAKQDFISGKSRVMLISLRAGAGMDGLQHVCRTVVYVELDWSPGVLMQATARVARDGQPDVVMEYFLVSDEGSDPVMSGVLGIKRAQLEGVRDMTTNIIEEVPLDKIRQLAEDYLKRAGIAVDTVVEEIELPGV